MTDNDHQAKAARHLLRSASFGSLATIMRDTDGAPYASMVAVATDHDGSPILLISDLADHTKNLKQNGQISLLLIGHNTDEDPMTGERLTLQGSISSSAEASLRQRFLARHPSAARYADFGDFGFYRVTIERAHLVAGFGRIHWIPGARLTIDPPKALIEAESEIVAHMNDDHADAVELYATKLLHRANGAWRVTGVDMEGADLRCQGQIARLPFGTVVKDSTDVRNELVRLVNKAREA